MLRARLVAFLASLLLLWPLGATAHARYFCRMMDRVMDSCCCPRESSGALHEQAELRSADCCERWTQGALPAGDARRDAATPGWLPALLAAREHEVPAAFQREVLARASVAGDAVVARGPPLFLKHCVFLI